MSATDAFIKAGLDQAFSNVRSYFDNRQSDPGQSAQCYQLVADWNNLVTRFNTERDACQAAYNQIDTLMAFINAGRMAQGQPALLLP